MNFNEYQKAAMRTLGGINDPREMLNLGALGISGEAGEVTDYIKKILFHNHELDREKLAKELGDVLWYVAVLSEAIGINMETIAGMNIEKLKKRYPDGFSSTASLERQD